MKGGLSIVSLIINAVSARAGGGINDLAHTLPLLRVRLGGSIRAYVAPEGDAALRAAGDSMEGVVCVAIASPLQRMQWELWRFPRLVKTERPSVVFQFSNFTFRRLAVPQIVVLRSPTFFSEEYGSQRRRGAYQRFRYRIGRWASVRTINEAVVVQCISTTHRAQIIRSCGEVGKRVEVNHLGIDVPASAGNIRGDRRSVVGQLPSEMQNALSLIDQGDVVAVNVAHYYQHKNFLTLLRAIDKLSATMSRLRLILTAGICDYRGAVGQQEREEMALAKALTDRGVLIDLGPIPKQQVWPLLRLADVFVFPSSLESFGHPLLEAMSMRVPVVASDTPIHREIGGEAAVYHETFAPDSLAAQVQRVLADETLRAAMIASGKQNVRRFTWENHVDKLVAAITRVVHSPAVAAAS